MKAGQIATITGTNSYRHFLEVGTKVKIVQVETDEYTMKELSEQSAKYGCAMTNTCALVELIDNRGIRYVNASELIVEGE